jgi:hypothetical protein
MSSQGFGFRGHEPKADVVLAVPGVRAVPQGRAQPVEQTGVPKSHGHYIQSGITDCAIRFSLSEIMASPDIAAAKYILQHD